MRIIVAAIAAALVAGAPVHGAPGVIHLVSPSDAATQRGASTILGPRPGEFANKAPGPITGNERIQVQLKADGSVANVIVDQTLVVHGTGDYTIEISGPATKVVPPAGARTHPGLRRGSVIWEGFSPGVKELRATITIDTTGLRFLPLPLRLSAVGGKVRIANATAAPRPYEDGVPDAASLAAVLDSMRASLRAHIAPVAGKIGVPLAIAGRPASTSIADVEVSMDVRGSGLEITAIPALPDATVLAPLRGASSWRAALAGASDAELRAALRLAQVTLWQVQRIQEYEAYLGNPLGGTSKATYVYMPAPAAAAAPKPKPRERAKPVPIAIALFVIALLGVRAAVWWQRH